MSLDKSNMLGSIEAFLDQCLQAWEEGQKVAIPPEYREVTNIVVSGMGGSALGAHLIQSLYQNDGLKVPLQIVNDYHLPSYTGENTLVLLSSYSGGTEETLSCAKEALQKRAKILGITTGGKLGGFLRENNFPGYIFDPKFNPCGQPRIGLGYSFFGQLGLLKQVGFLDLNSDKIYQFIDILIKKKEEIREAGMGLVKLLANKLPVVVGAEFLAGNAHVLANQFNENAKIMSFYFLLPEMNHHLLEGLKNPDLRNLTFLFLESDLYREIIKKRLSLTREVIGKNGHAILEFKPSSEDPFPQVLETLWFGSFLSFYLAINYRIDPSPIPWVDFFKEKLS